MLSEADVSKAFRLLAECDGRDKVNKLLAGVFRVLAVGAERRGDPRAAAFRAAVGLLSGARAVMNLGKFAAEAHKLRGLVAVLAVLPPAHAPPRRVLECVRLLLSGLFIVADNLALVAGAGLVGLARGPVARRARRLQFLGYVAAAGVDALDFREALWRRRYDPPAAARAATNAALRAVHDTLDALANAAALGYLGPALARDERVVGGLSALAAALALGSHWRGMR